jgi:hypothetical protein
MSLTVTFDKSLLLLSLLKLSITFFENLLDTFVGMPPDAATAFTFSTVSFSPAK